MVVLVALNSTKHPGADEEERAVAVRRGVRDTTDLRTEYRLAAMNESLGVPTVFLPAHPELAAVSSTALRSLPA